MQTKMTRFRDSVVKTTVLGILFACVIPVKILAQGPPPVITVQPSDCNAILGGTATFTVAAASGTTLSYQWYKDGLLNLDTKIAGATTSTLTINMGPLDGGTYYAEVKNAGGKVTSRHASLTLVLANSPPTANDNSYTTAEDVPLTISTPGILANDADTDGNSLTALLVRTPAHGSLSLNANGGFSYTPNTNYNGTDSFSYVAHDGVITGNVATVTINITSVNDQPFTVDDSVVMLEDDIANIGVLDNDSDPDGTPLIVTGASTTNGTVNLTANGTRVLFKPPAHFNGTVVFSYTVFDGTASATGNVTVAVTPVNDAPVANDDAYTTSQDIALTNPAATLTPGILANDTDVEGDALTAQLVSDVTHGSLALNPDGSFTYTPAPDYNGLDSFTYRASDGAALGNLATVTINVTPNQPPMITSQRMTTNGFELHVAGNASAYVISASSNLNDWTPIFTNSSPTGPIVYTDTAAHNYPSRFFRTGAR